MKGKEGSNGALRIHAKCGEVTNSNIYQVSASWTIAMDALLIV